MIRRLGRWIEDNLTPSGPAHSGLAKKIPRRGEGSLRTTQKLTGWERKILIGVRGSSSVSQAFRSNSHSVVLNSIMASLLKSELNSKQKFEVPQKW